jgi:putative membrane-bound dehydrogenase-like protein
MLRTHAAREYFNAISKMAMQIQRRRVHLAALVYVLWWAGASVCGAQQDSLRPHHVPDGFALEKVAGDLEVRFPMFATFDERGRLFVAESSGGDLYAELKAQTRRCQVRLLEDRDNDGRFETSRLFTDSLVFPMGLVWREEKLFVADPPDLVTFEDTNGDGRADERHVLLTGFGHTDNGSLHGLTFGPDGLLYMTMGEPDGYRFELPDGSILEGQSGALIRCRLDGSDVRVLCRGFENLVEIVFTARGEIIGTDNWYQWPKGGFRDALLHLVEGGMYPMHPDKGTPQPVTGEPLPPMSLFPAVALSGLELYRGSAFPAEMRGNLFSAQHNARKVMRHVLLPNGSTFRTRDEDFLTSDDPDFHPSDVLEDADGSLLVLDTGSWYVHHCPTGRIRKSPATGGIYRVRRTDSARPLDPWGVRIAWTNTSTARLTAMLTDGRPAIRDRAKRHLSSHGSAAAGELAGVLNGFETTAAKQSAIEALAIMDNAEALNTLRRALTNPDPDVVATAIRAVAMHRDQADGSAFTGLLDHNAPFVRLAAAEALSHCGDTNSLPHIWHALAGTPDRFLEHALIHAAHRLADMHVLRSSLSDPSPRVQKTALLLLSQPRWLPDTLKPDVVLQRITAADPDLRQTALRVLQQRTDWAQPASTVVQSWLQQPDLSPEQHRALPGLLQAFGSTAVMQLPISDALGHAAAPTQTRLLRCMAQAGVAPATASATNSLKRLLVTSGNLELRGEALRLTGSLRLAGFDRQLEAIAQGEAEPAALRLEALRALVRGQPTLSANLFDFVLAQLERRDEPITSLSAAEVLHQAYLTDVQVLRAVRVVRGARLIPISTLLSAWREVTTEVATRDLFVFLTESVREGATLRESDLDRVLSHLSAKTHEQAAGLRTLLRDDMEASRAKLARYEKLLDGGNVERGRLVFRSGQAACAACHAIGGEGGHIGPDLTTIGAIRSGQDILESIVVPSSTLAQGFEPYVAVTLDGDELWGVLAQQSNEAIVMRDASGTEVRVARTSLRELRRQEVSIMPEGLEAALTEAEFRDLIAFLQSLR